MNATDCYQVVGVRADGSRMVVCQYVTKRQSDGIKMSLETLGVFPTVEIKVGNQAPQKLSPRAVWASNRS